MTEFPVKDVASYLTAGRPSDTLLGKSIVTSGTVQKENQAKSPKVSSWTTSSLANSFSLLDLSTNSSPRERREVKSRIYGWMASLRKAMSSGSMRRLQEHILGWCKTDISGSTSEIWLLGVCYKISSEESTNSDDLENGLLAFQQDFSSRIWITYRKGFDVIGDTKLSSDVHWGCMIRSSQMLVAQALVCHHMGRSWRRIMQKPYDPKYIEVLQLFGDSMDSAFSVHNLLLAGKAYGLAAGSWVGPYAMCRSWEVLTRSLRDSDDPDKQKLSLPMAVYVVSGDENGERGGAPVFHIDVASRLCSEFQKEESTWAPIMLLVPLVLGLEKINPRYIPLLWKTFTFPQNLGILGGRSSSSTYIVGVQDDKAFYLDPHELHPVVTISKDDLEADTSSYHCSTVRHMPLEQIDPSLAIGFYCRDKDDLDDFCARATVLAEISNGAPLFTVAKSPQPANQNYHTGGENFLLGNVEHQHEDDWQLL